MSRVGRVTETGIQHRAMGRALRWLRILREDLWTARVDPLPPSVWLRWLPHGLLSLAAFGVTVGGLAQLQDSAGMAFGWALVVTLGQSGAVVLAMWRPIPAWWLSLTATVTGAIAVHGELGGRPEASPGPGRRPGSSPTCSCSCCSPCASAPGSPWRRWP